MFRFKPKRKRNKAGNAPEKKPGRSARLALAKRAAGRMLYLLLLCGGTSLVLLAAFSAAASSSIFQIKQPMVIGTSHLSRLEVLSAAGIGAETNLATMRVSQVERRVKKLPWVKEAVVRRRLPGALEIRVTEYDPAHLALVAGKLYFLSRNMHAYTPLKPHEGLPDLPVITGLSLGDLIHPSPACLSLLNSAADLVAALPKNDREAGGGLSEIHLDEVWGLSLIWGSIAPTIRLGLDDYVNKLLRLDRVLDDLKSRGELSRAQLIDLSDPRRTVVRMEG